MERHIRMFIATLAFASLPSLALANARLVAVIPLDGGCVSGPTGPAVQAWDVEAGKTYRLRITEMWECGTLEGPAALDVRVNSTKTGNTDLVATWVSDGTYEFDFTLPANAGSTMPMFYCTTPGKANTGLLVTRNDGGKYQAHLRVATFSPGCKNPKPVAVLPGLVLPGPQVARAVSMP